MLVDGVAFTIMSSINAGFPVVASKSEMSSCNKEMITEIHLAPRL